MGFHQRQAAVGQRVRDLISGFDGWVDLTIRRLHEIHRLIGAECEACGKYLDGDLYVPDS
jgi:hypothetical protein